MHVGISAFQVCAGVERWASMPGPRDVDEVGPRLPNQPVQMHIDEILPGGCPPMSEEPRFDVFFLQWLLYQRVIQQIYLAHAQIVRRVPVAMDLIEHAG